MKNKNSS